MAILGVYIMCQCDLTLDVFLRKIMARDTEVVMNIYAYLVIWGHKIQI